MFFIGTRTSPNRGTGRGLLIVDDNWQVTDVIDLVNPGCIAVDPERGTLHVAHGDGTTVSSFAVGDSGALHSLGEKETGGANPAHIAVSDGHLYGVNHTSSSVFSISIEEDGSLGDRTDLLHLKENPGPHADQPCSKPHQVCFLHDGTLVVPDKGTDHLVFLSTDSGKLKQTGVTKLREGSGPRHAVATAGTLYVVGEIDSTVSVLHHLDGEWVSVQVHTTLSSRDPRDSRAAGIVVVGGMLYVSNRSGAGDSTPGGPGDDSLAVFSIEEDGLLQPRGHVSSRGIRPRFISASSDGRALWVANEKSGSVWEFPLENDGGLGELRRLLQEASPVWIAEYGAAPR